MIKYYNTQSKAPPKLYAPRTVAEAMSRLKHRALSLRSFTGCPNLIILEIEDAVHKVEGVLHDRDTQEEIAHDLADVIKSAYKSGLKDSDDLRTLIVNEVARVERKHKINLGLRRV